ncbi:ATP-binding protein [Streptomyces sp. NPDC052299]|uniref:ATP-binding protein n=1 Tax=Streptomyces sp. NPDC052299 TaxID=3155054 RepID=UPI00343A9E5C
MTDSALPARPAVVGHRRGRPPRLDPHTLRRARRAVSVPLVLLAAVLAAALSLRSVSAVGPGWVVVGLGVGLVVVALVAARATRTVAAFVDTTVTEARTETLAAVETAAAAVEKSLRWSVEELCRGGRPPVPEMHSPRRDDPNAGVLDILNALQVQAIISLVRVHDESQSFLLLEVLRRLAQREHALVGKALEALTQLEKLTDDPELLHTSFQIDHLVTRIRRHVESTAVLGGQSLRSARQPVPLATVLRGAVCEVLQYPRVSVAAGSAGAEIGLPGHVGPDLTHLLAELIENALECSDPATKVTVRAQRVAAGLAIEVEDRAVPIHPQVREQMNRLLAAPDRVDVSNQVRAGQLGLLVAAKIAQAHGMTVRLQENVLGSTNALVVVPDRLLVPFPSVQDPGVSSSVARPSVVPPPATHTPAHAVAQARIPQGTEPAEDPPPLPTRKRAAETSGLPPERERVTAPPPSPGIAGAFHAGLKAGTEADSPPASTQQTGP